MGFNGTKKYRAHKTMAYETRTPETIAHGFRPQDSWSQNSRTCGLTKAYEEIAIAR